MDLKIKDVSELLGVSKSTIARWIEEGKLPSYRINEEQRFSRSEVENWLLQQTLEGRLEGDEVTVPSNLQFGLYRALYRGDTLTVSGSTKEEIIGATMEEMARRFDLDAAVLTELFVEREKLMSTAVGHGIAVPHTRDFLLDTHFDVLLLVYPEEPIPYDALDGEDVHTLFFLFASEDRHHLNLLSKVAHLNVNPQARVFFASHPSKSEVLAYLKRWEATLK